MKGLADEKIRRQVLSVVEEMDLDTTIKFIEAKESGKKAGVYLDNGEAALNKITSYRQAHKNKSVSKNLSQMILGVVIVGREVMVQLRISRQRRKCARRSTENVDTVMLLGTL